MRALYWSKVQEIRQFEDYIEGLTDEERKAEEYDPEAWLEQLCAEADVLADRAVSESIEDKLGPWTQPPTKLRSL